MQPSFIVASCHSVLTHLTCQLHKLQLRNASSSGVGEQSNVSPREGCKLFVEQTVRFQQNPGATELMGFVQEHVCIHSKMHECARGKELMKCVWAWEGLCCDKVCSEVRDVVVRG